MMVAVAMVAVLAVMVVPSLGDILARRKVQATANALVADMRLARTEALKRATTAAVCRSSDGQACEAQGGSWHVGWIVLVGKQVLRVQEAPPGIATIQNDKPNGTTLARINYNATGRKAGGVTQTFRITPSGGAAQGAANASCVAVSQSGRASLRPSKGEPC